MTPIRGNVVRVVSFLAAVFAAIPLLAHPMGNFSVNHYSGIKLTPDSIELRYLIDMAEIPTFQELQAAGLKPDPQDPHIPGYLRSKADEFSRGITLKLDGQAARLECSERQVIFPPGAGGLPTMKYGFTCRAPLAGVKSGQHLIEYRDDNFPGRAGWKEIIVNADAALGLVTQAPHSDRSGELSNYPTDLLNSPPQDLNVNAMFTLPIVAQAAQSGGARAASNRMRAIHPASAPSPKQRQAALPSTTAVGKIQERHSNIQAPGLQPNAQGTPRSAFTQLIAAQNLSLWFLVSAAFIAMGLGALHALEPGHGKTLVAAYLVGSRGTAAHAVLLGGIVTLAHTAGVYALGAVTLYASQYIVPEKLYPWLGVVSGLVIVVFGLLMFLRRWVNEDPALTKDHRHWYDKAVLPAAIGPHASQATGDPSPRSVPMRQLLVLGITGGLVPCPAALVVLLSAIALHRIGFGFFLIVAFSSGLAAVLIAIGLLMVRAGRMMSRLNPASQLVRRQLPLLSAAFITMVGVLLVAQSARTAGMASRLPSFGSPKWLLVAGVGLLLGMRHSTDPDHVIAVTTIVTRLRKLRHATLVGVLWGVGHTFTIFVVGSAIILFGIVIPPRVGLSMEFAVALMLILLGVLNLTGLLAWFTRKFTPATSATQEVRAMRVAPSGSERMLDGVISQLGGYQLLRPLVIGLVHGLAGSAAVALLVLATIHNPVWAIGYLLLFGLGTVAGMMLMTAAIAMPVVWTGKNFTRLNRYMCATSGIVSVAFGLFLVYQIGFVSGLFSAVPKWIPE